MSSRNRMREAANRGNAAVIATFLILLTVEDVANYLLRASSSEGKRTTPALSSFSISVGE